MPFTAMLESCSHCDFCFSNLLIKDRELSSFSLDACGSNGGDWDGVWSGVSEGEMMKDALLGTCETGYAEGGERWAAGLSWTRLGVMYKFMADCEGELGLDFLLGWANSKFKWVSDSCLGTAAAAPGGDDLSGVMRGSCEMELMDVKLLTDWLDLSFSKDAEDAGRLFWK